MKKYKEEHTIDLISEMPHNNGEEVKVTFKVYSDMDVVDIFLDGKKVLSGDWDNNCKKFFRQCLKKVREAKE